MSVALNLDVANADVLCAGRWARVHVLRSAPGSRSASGALAAGPARCRCEQSTVFIPPNSRNDRSYRPQHFLFCFTHRRTSHPFTNTQSAPPLLLPSARLECTVAGGSGECCVLRRPSGGVPGWRVCGAVPA